MVIFRRLMQLLFHLGYFGPVVMGVLDSSFLVLPFGNDLLIVRLVAQHPRSAPGYIVCAAIGSTIGALLLALVSRRLGEAGFSRIAGERQYHRLKGHLKHAGIAVAVGGLAPPPFPFTTVIAGVAALKYPLSRILAINFLARAARFTLLALLAIHYGKSVLNIVQTTPFEWAMVIFIAACVVASGLSISHWMRHPA
jgi:membrane protein YqaA with SNARE-associated domain